MLKKNIIPSINDHCANRKISNFFLDCFVSRLRLISRNDILKEAFSPCVVARHETKLSNEAIQKRACALTLIAISTVCFLTVGKCFAEGAQSAFSPIMTINTQGNGQPASGSGSTINLNNPKAASVEVKVIDLGEKDAFYNFTGATDKFVQSNIKASWEDFKDLIDEAPPNDFIYMSIASKMADLGLFDLANLAASKIQDKEISKISMDAMKRFYFPKKNLKLEDELELAEIYSDILYNDQSSESTAELLKNSEILSKSDYANYLVAFGSYKSNLFSRANQYIDLAIIQNPANLNYQKLKAEILAEGSNPTEAIKIVENLKKQNLYSYEYERKINSLEQYVLYKTKTAEWEKNYHLGYYYHFENDDSKAIKSLQTALSSKKKGNNGVVYGLMSEIYLGMNEFEKASDTAKKSYAINRNNPHALLTLGDLSYSDKNYAQALKYYKQAASIDKIAYAPILKEAQAYQKLSNTKKAQELYTKILKTHSDCWEAYYNIGLLDKTKEIAYTKKALAVNPLFKDGWIELAKIEFDKANYLVAQKYLANAFYLDENDFRYYYYQGLVNKNLGNYTQAEYDFKKCLKLNNNYKEALDELKNSSGLNVSNEDRI